MLNVTTYLKNKRRNYFLMLTGLILNFSCAKEKIDDIKNNRIQYPFITSSSARMVLVKNMDIEVNGKRITNWEAPRTGEFPEIPPFPTPYFPTSGKPGSTYHLPQEFFDQSGKASVKLFNGGGGLSTDFQAEDNYNAPWDYYRYTDDRLSAGFAIAKVSRPNVQPAAPKNILIRLLNLSSLDGVNIKAGEKISLAYADGTKVSKETSGIEKGKWSSYAEIPYGTYDFHVMIDGSIRQCHLLPVQSATVTSETDYTLVNEKMYITQKRLFQPGGVYTVVVSLSGRYEVSETFVPIYLNSFQLITDKGPNANLTYARIQGINVFGNTIAEVFIDGRLLEKIAFSKASDYAVIPIGKHEISFKDGAGKELNSISTTIKAGDNLSFWLYPKKDGTAGISTIQNNMSGFNNVANSPDGSDGSTAISDPSLVQNMDAQTRFLNFCPELAQVTFTGKNGQPLAVGTGSSRYPIAAANLPFGLIHDPMVLPFPYLALRPSTIEAYLSEPGLVPGNRLYDVSVLESSDFISMPVMHYPNGIPKGEPGIYTVALIGHYTSQEKPKMLVIKHNK